MHPLRVRRADIKQLLSLLLVLAIWANYFCPTGHARVSPAPPADPPKAPRRVHSTAIRNGTSTGGVGN